jgi:4-phosphopantoate---beta-alanine ligase
MMVVPDSHPRKASLELRHRLLEGFRAGLVVEAGLIAHGRGEAFDYLLGERTHEMALASQKAAVWALKNAVSPVLSVNGNVAALCPAEVVGLSRAVNAKVEVNLFYRTFEREERIRDVLLKAGAEGVYGVGLRDKTIPGLDSERGRADEAILGSDVVLVMLEDGDRCERLVGMGKKVIAVDLNPLSRTAQMAHISVVDDVCRALSNMIKISGESIEEIEFDNRRNLEEMISILRKGF